MKLFFSIMVGLGVVACILCAGWLLKDEERKEIFNPEDIVTAIGLGLLVGIVNYYLKSFAPGTDLYFMAPICLAVLLGISVFAMVWWGRVGADWRGMLPLVALVVLLFLPTQAAAVLTAAAIPQSLWATLVLVLPLVMLVLAVGFMVTNWLYFRWTLTQSEIDKILAIIVGIATGVVILLLLIANVDWKNQTLANDAYDDIEYEDDVYGDELEADETVMAVNEEQQVVEDVSAEELGVTWYKFYHYELLKDDDITDDFNFGLSAYAEGTTADQAKAVHFQRVEDDPALGVATFATFDVRLGTDFIMPGEHYDQNWSDGYWTTRINERAQYYMSNQERYEIAVERWENFVDKYTVVTLNYQQGITDQMYMVSLTSQSELEAPEVIIAETTQPDGHILSYKTLIKGNEFVVPFRTDCGFQPTNVAEPMRETPQQNPVVKATGKDPQISKDSKNTDPNPSADPTPKSDPNPDPKPSSDPNPKPDPSPKPTPTPTPTPETDTPKPTPTPTPETDTPTPKPTPQTETDPPKPTPDTPNKDPQDDPVNQGSADKGGGQNKQDDGPGEIQPVDPRTETPTGSSNDNNHGHSDPATVTPSTPPVVEEHKQDPVVVDENKTSYKPDPVTDRGPTDPAIEPTSPEGDGEFTPAD